MVACSVIAIGNEFYTAELENVRALPYGYTAVCHMPDLKLQSASSATFVVRDSLLCAVAVQHRVITERETFVLCSNDPELALNDDSTALPDRPPECVDLDLVYDATEL